MTQISKSPNPFPPTDQQGWPIEYVDAPCASGKTYSACRYIDALLTSCNYLYVAPTIDLIDEVATILRKRHVDPKIIHSRNSSSVKRDIIEHLKNPGRWETSK